VDGGRRTENGGTAEAPILAIFASHSTALRAGFARDIIIPAQSGLRPQPRAFSHRDTKATKKSAAEKACLLEPPTARIFV
jgi:hypothetical protein